MKSLAALKRAALVALVVGFVGARATDAYAVAWINAGSSTAWYTAGNWSPSTAPGAWTTTDLAQFNNTGSALTAGINMATAGTPVANALSIGAIEVSSARTRVLTIGNSSGTTGTLILNGTTVNNSSAVPIANTILRNGSGFLLTLQNNDTGSGKTMNISLANATDNVIQLDGAGNIAISSVISGVGRHITLQGVGTGRLLLSGQNTYSGGTTIMTDATLSTTGASSNGGFTAGPLGTGTLTIDGGEYIASSSGTNTIANNITLKNVSTNEIAVGGTSTLSGNITGDGGFRKSSSGTLILSGTNNYSGPTLVDNGTVAFAQKVSLYNGNSVDWTDTNLIVNATRTAVFVMGGSGFSSADIGLLSNVGSPTGGFATGSNFGIDTSIGSQTLSDALVNPNAGANKINLIKSGANTLTLGVANTFSGTTTVTTGTLNLADQLALQNSTLTSAGVTFDQSVGGNAFTLGGLSGSGNIALQNNAGPPVGIALSVGNNNENTTYTGVLSGPGSLAKIGTGSLTLTIANTYTGGTTLDAGTVNVNASAAVFGTGLLTLNTGAALDNTTGTNRTLGGTVPQLWNGNFAFLGTRALNLGAGAVTMGGNIDVTVGVTTPTPTQDAVNFALTVGGVISDSGNNYTLTKSGPGRFYLSGQNTFTGGVIVNGGSVHANEQNSNLGGGMGPFGTGTLALNSGRMLASSTGTTVSTIENDIALTGPAYTAGSGNLITANGTLTLSGTISGTGGLGKSGSGTTTLTGNNSYQGGTTINGGTLSLGSNGASGTGNITIGELLDTATLNIGTGGADGSVSGNISFANTTGTSIVNFNRTTDLAYNGSISGANGVVNKLNSNKLVLGGTNTYTGATNVVAGTLLVNGNNSAATGAVNVASGATLGGNGTVGGATTIANGGTLSPGNSIDTMYFVDDLTIDGTHFWEHDGLLNGDVANVADTLTINALATLTGDNLGVAAVLGTKFLLFNYQTAGAQLAFGNAPNLSQILIDGQYWRIDYDDPNFLLSVNNSESNGYANGVTLTAVPEASSLIVMGLGGLFAIGAVWLGKRCGWSLSRL